MIFVDTSFWIALRNRRDPRHAEAATLLRSRADGGLATSNQVRGETWTYLRRRVGHDGAVEFLDALERSPRIQLFSITEIQEQRALKWLRQGDEREYSFVDATSFVLMRELRIREVLAFDGDFSAAGFMELRA
ncbi:MAG TPA: PIN domain-containing protein [Thermoanaerobaculia bacterium]|nr:PIN domain-containing protein [Thermoanaerobaculia bacterium]